jgi:protease-4
MRQFFKMFFASLLAMVVAGVLVIGLIVGLIVSAVSEAGKSGKDNKLESGSMLVVELDKAFHEQGEKNPFASFSKDVSYNAGLYDALRAIAHAQTDDNIRGIVLRMKGNANGWATSQQLRQALEAFKAGGKRIYAYGENISQNDYYIASVADSVFINPVGMMELKGLSSTLVFFKGTLDKLDIEPEIFYAGKFKSATEPFRAERMSPENRQQMMALQQDIWQQMVGAVARHTKADTATIMGWVRNDAIQFPAQAVERRLIEGARYWDEVEDMLRSYTGRKADEKVRYISLDEYTEKVRGNRKLQDEKVAVLFAEGEIIDGKSNNDYQIASEDFAESIRKLRRNDKIKAVVLRVNSPGGSAQASEVILRELQLLKAKKPLIVSMGDVAASGGYYIASYADSIFALPTTITGSIGVFGMLFNVEDMMKNKLGVTFDEVKNAPYADFPTAARPLNAEERRRMQAVIDTIYVTFKQRVVNGRKLSATLIDSVAQGRVWTGEDALAIGLVDGLGNLDRAIKSAAAKADLKGDYQVVTYPEPVDRFESLMRRFSGSNASSAAAISTAIANELGPDYDFYRQARKLRRMNGKAMMYMPFTFTIR